MVTVRPLLVQRYLGATLRDWLIAFALACAVSLSLLLVQRFALGRARRFAARNESRLDDLVVSVLTSLRGLFFLALGLWVAAEYVAFSPAFEQRVRTAVALLSLFQIGLSLQASVHSLAQGWARASADGESRMAASTWAFLGSLAIWSVLIVSSLSVLGFQISALLAGLGVGGVAAALAVQNILGDLFASLSIYFDRPFHIGDFISVGNEKGTVERIGLRTTRVRSLGGEEIVFANGDLTKSRLHNFRRMETRRVQFGFAVEYETPLAELREIPNLVQAIIEARPNARFERAHLNELGDASLNFEVVYYVLSPDFNLHMDLQHAINLELIACFSARGTQFAFRAQKALMGGGARH
jgi:small-conductance mechanosensitive channel